APDRIRDLVADSWVHVESNYRKDGQPTRKVANIRSASLEEPGFSAIVERYLNGLSVAEIAARHGISPAAVGQRLARPEGHLRVRLERIITAEKGGWLIAALPMIPAAAPAISETGSGVKVEVCSWPSASAREASSRRWAYWPLCCAYRSPVGVPQC